MSAVNGSSLVKTAKGKFVSSQTAQKTTTEPMRNLNPQYRSSLLLVPGRLEVSTVTSLGFYRLRVQSTRRGRVIHCQIYCSKIPLQ